MVEIRNGLLSFVRENKIEKRFLSIKVSHSREPSVGLTNGPTPSNSAHSRWANEILSKESQGVKNEPKRWVAAANRTHDRVVW